ncbi:MAG: hypothetical protein ISR42_09465 [Acidimicrobiia bacterium]|nr:hypothetical protein [Acidimicrobiia bacterium]
MPHPVAMMGAWPSRPGPCFFRAGTDVGVGFMTVTPEGGEFVVALLDYF